MSHGRIRTYTLWVLLLALPVSGAGLSAGCDVLNPSLFSGGLLVSPISTLDSPEGFIPILVMNQTPASVQVDVTITKENDSSKAWQVSTAPLDFFAFVQDCEVRSIDISSFSFSSVGGTIEVPANLGTLNAGVAFNCGDVIAVTLRGSAPNISITVEVFR